MFQLQIYAADLLHFLDDVFRQIFQVVIAGIERNVVFNDRSVGIQQTMIGALPPASDLVSCGWCLACSTDELLFLLRQAGYTVRANK
ncbi:MAG TPA: hypothetical protein PLD59_11975 [Tepidisphaeraceae bacterium]|nr:hypothetical protein [Tepidisphaeraceae bacterium]